MKLCSFRSLAVAAALASLALIPAATPAPRQPDGIQRLDIHAQAIEFRGHECRGSADDDVRAE